MNQPKYIAQGLLQSWNQEKEKDTSFSKVCPLMYYLQYNYQERYVKLCHRLDIQPVNFGAWLRKPIQSIQ